MIHLHYTALVRLRCSPGRGWRYLASRDALASAIKQACADANFTGPTDPDVRWSVELAVQRSGRRRYHIEHVVAAVTDAAKGIVWQDDSQVAHLAATKREPGEDGEDCLWVTFWMIPTLRQVA